MAPKPKTKTKTTVKKVLRPLIHYAYENEANIIEAFKTGVTENLTNVELLKFNVIKERRAK